MKTLKPISTIICSILLIMYFFSCKKENEPNYEYFLIKVDSVNVPESITANTPFEIDFFGTIGTNGCFQFSQFETNIFEKEIQIKVWGKYDKNAKSCPTVMVYLEGQTLRQSIIENGNYTLKVIQPDNTYLEEHFVIR